MKLVALISAGLFAAIAAPVVASAQTVVHTERTVVRESHVTRRPAVRRVCRVEYHHHKRVRTCRTVRR